MKPLKYSRQREAIAQFLHSCTEHPTADVVYENVRKEFPHISLGTVYRNLNLLVERHEAMKITSKGGSDRFDARMVPHYHFICTVCNCVKDVLMPPIPQVEQEAVLYTNDVILKHDINYYGVCAECNEKQKENIEIV